MSSHASIASAIMADSEPELLSASVPIFVRSMAMTSTALAFISDENDVYTWYAKV